MVIAVVLVVIAVSSLPNRRTPQEYLLVPDLRKVLGGRSSRNQKRLTLPGHFSRLYSGDRISRMLLVGVERIRVSLRYTSLTWAEIHSAANKFGPQRRMLKRPAET